MTSPTLVRAGTLRCLVGLVALMTAVLGAVAPAAASSAPTRWVSPLTPLVVVHGFDPPAGPYGPGHRGVDLAGRVDQEVRAAADGTVTFAGQIGGLGVVVVSHGRIRTTYQPLWGITIPLGAAVRGGDGIGQLATLGSHCRPTPCLHWGAIAGETYLDPLTLLDPGPSRLLPYWGSARIGTRDDAGQTGLMAETDQSGRQSGAAASADPRLRLAAGSIATLTTATRAAVTTTAAVETAMVPLEPRRRLPAGVAAAGAALGGLVAGAVFLLVRRRRG